MDSAICLERDLQSVRGFTLHGIIIEIIKLHFTVRIVHSLIASLTYVDGMTKILLYA